MFTTLLAATAASVAAPAGAGGPVDPFLVVISEIRIDQPSADDDEFFELQVLPGGATLDGLTYLVIGDGAGGSGVIESVTPLDGNVSDANGFFVVAESTFTAGTANLTATLDFENSDNVTHLVVRDFTGADGDDLDTDDDGVLDVTPWSSVVDAVSLVETPDSGDLFYGAALGGVDVGPSGTFVPGHVFRCLTTLTDWRIGVFGPVGTSDTPGAENPCLAERSEFCAPAAANDVSAAGGQAVLLGTGSLQLNDSALVALNVTDGFGLFAFSDMVTAPMPAAIGGNMCIGVNPVRMNRILAISGTQATLPLDFTDMANAEFGTEAGQTRYYQFFYRDGATGLGGNFTTGVAVTWAP